jgi:phosphotriesterase-related protein
LVHEHILVDFIGADAAIPGRYDPEDVYQKILPLLQSLKSKGCQTLVECTPMYLGRDVKLLQRLSKATGLHIITNTGWYGASKEKFLPSKIREMSASQIAQAWINEARNGIDGSGIKPGFMKIALDNVPFSDNIRKILEAAVITYKETGLPVGVHTSNGGAPAKEQIAFFRSKNLPLEKWIWIHAQIEPDISVHAEAAKQGAWISFDGISRSNMEEYRERLESMKKRNLLQHVIISQDAGWYDVVEPSKPIRDYNDLLDHFIPHLRSKNFTESDIQQLLVKNPARLFTVKS